MQYVYRDTPYFRQSNAEGFAQVMNLDEFNERRNLTAKRQKVERLELAQKHCVCAEDILGSMLKAISETTDKSGTFAHTWELNFASCKPFIANEGHATLRTGPLEKGVIEQVREGLQKRRIPVHFCQKWQGANVVLCWEMK